MKVAVLGAGAFGTALALTLAQKAPVTLWSHDAAHAAEMARTRENRKRLPGFALPETLAVTADTDALTDAKILLVSVPMQMLRAFIEAQRAILRDRVIVACCKGMEKGTALGPMEVIAAILPETRGALLTGPSFAEDIARGLPTALTLACTAPDLGQTLQDRLSTPALRLYRTTDVTGAQLGGALKNVIAIACGAAMGAGLGESARAALMTRGNAEMMRLAAHKGADPATLSGLSGFGDLVLTCTSRLSRNYRFGQSLGGGTEFDPDTTVEGAATAVAVAAHAAQHHIDMPISTAVAALVEKRLDVSEAMRALLSRSLKEE